MRDAGVQVRVAAWEPGGRPSPGWPAQPRLPGARNELSAAAPAPATVIELGCGPGIAQQGFTLYDRDDQVAAVFEQAGFARPAISISGAPDRPMGRLALSTPTPQQATADTAAWAQKG